MYACMHATEEGAHIVAQILRAAGDMRHRVKLVNQVDQEGWNAFHFAWLVHQDYSRLSTGLKYLKKRIARLLSITCLLMNQPKPDLHLCTLQLEMAIRASLKPLYEGTHGNKISMKHLININRKTT